MRQLFCRFITFPLQDFKNKTQIIKSFKFLLKSQKWNIEKLENFQLEKVKKLIHYSYDNVPFYNELYKKHNIKPNDINSLNDLNKLPVITKEDVRNAKEKIYSTKYKTNKYFLSKTGGTTGVPLHLIKDSNDLSLTWGAYYRWINSLGLKIGDHYSKVWGTNTVLQTSLLQKIYNNFKDIIYNRSFINSFNINDKTLPFIVKQLNSTKPKFIRGYLSALIQIAEYIISNNITLKFKPIAISPTTETLLPPFRRLLEKAFSAPVFDQYGCGECNSMAFECNAHEGLHVVNEHVIIQILDQNNNMITDNDGRIILTNLDNYAMPLIRYENGDSACQSSKLCSCEMKHPLLTKINGRTIDTIVLKDGSPVHGVFFTDLLDELFNKENIIFKRFQVYQTIPGNIEFRLESKSPISKLFITELHNALQQFFNKVEIKEVDSLIFDKSGKFRYIISEIN